MYRLPLTLLMSFIFAACVSTPPLPDGPVPSQVPSHIESALRKIGPVIDPPATSVLFVPVQQREPYAGVKVARSESYGPDPRHLLDVFTPVNGGSARPVLVFVHGGAFTRGDRRTGDSPFYDNIMLWAVAHGMVGVNMTYRLAPQHAWPAAQEDIGRAVGWIRTQIAARGGDPSRIVLMGHSAGAVHVAQYIGHPRFHVAPGGGIAGAIMVSGLYDTTTAERNAPLQAYFGADASRYAERSPMPALRTTTLPMLFAYAELDPKDFEQQAAQVRAALCDSGRCRPMLKLLGHNHLSEVFSINTSDRALSDAMGAFVASLR